MPKLVRILLALQQDPCLLIAAVFPFVTAACLDPEMAVDLKRIVIRLLNVMFMNRAVLV